jgi:outer membrane protein TolC
MFDDPALRELIDTALAQNYDARLAMARVAEARALVGLAARFYNAPGGRRRHLSAAARLSRTAVEPPIPSGADTHSTTLPNSTSTSSGKSTFSGACRT